MKGWGHGLLGYSRYVESELPFPGAAGRAIGGDRVAEAAGRRRDPHRRQQVLMQLAQLGRDEIPPARGVLGVQPQHPVPEMVVDAGQGGGADLPGRQRRVRLGEDQVHLHRAVQDEHVAPTAGQPVPLRHHRAQRRDQRGQGLTSLGEGGRADHEVPVRPGPGPPAGARPG